MSELSELLAKHVLLIATHNQGKLREIQQLLAPYHIDCMSAEDKCLPEPEENGDTFVANAMIKSVAAANETDLPSLADDSGLVVPAIGGDPGIYSARWAGSEKNFDYAMKSVRIALEAKGQALDSEAYFVCVLSLALPKNTPSPLGGGLGWGQESIDSSLDAPLLTSPLRGEGNLPYTITTSKQEDVQCINIEGRVYGKLTFPPRGTKGFGYDPIFVPTGYAQTFGELSSAEKQTISHRANAFRGLMKVIRG